MKTGHFSRHAAGFCVAIGLVGCGDRAGFELIAESEKQGSSADAVVGTGTPGDGDANAPGAEKGGTSTDANPEAPEMGEGSGVGTEGVGSGSDLTPLEEDCQGDEACVEEGPIVVGVEGSDADALHRCLSKWKETEFGKEISNVREVYAATSVYGSGTVLKDVEKTEEPELVLIHASVNVLGNVKYKLMNPNGYYCIKVDVSVLQNLTIDLHCNARLADAKVNVNVGSEVNDSTAAVQVAVGSTVNVNVVDRNGDSCTSE